jgi:polyribonucleotide nucleotidyltransferase
MWKESVTIGERTITLETGRIARQAHGAVLVTDGNTTLLSTVVHDAGSGARDFFPLTVDYREYMSAGGRIPGSFLRREGRGGDREVLASRLCDRTIRPLFPKAFQAETQVISTLLSLDPDSDVPLLSIAGASAALHSSEIPWDGPVAAVRVGRVDGELIVFPNREQRAASDLDLAVSVSREGVVMIEGGGQQVPDGEMLAAINFAQAQAEPLLTLIETLRAAAGREKLALAEPAPPAFGEALRLAAQDSLRAALAIPEKLARRRAVSSAKAAALAAVPEADTPETRPRAQALLEALEAEILRTAIATEKRRVDSRGPADIRNITCEVDWLPGTHGSALFTRGETQAIVSLTLGSQQDRMMVETAEGVRFERFLLNYSFPPYSVGETRPLRGPGRREVGHGTLARRALEPVLPAQKAYPYTLRIVSEITESNGSSSMATVCGGTLALMDGGVPISAPVAGIAMGLIKEGDQLVVLSDILGDEDHLGDMDFKIAGTAEGITAIQMDNKLGSLPDAMMQQAFEQARQGRLHILEIMAQTLAAPRETVKPNAPLNDVISISPSRVGALIGPGGKVIQEIQSTTGCRIEVDNEGNVRVSAPTRTARDAAVKAIQEVAGTLEVGAVYEGEVTGIKDFGAFVRIRGQEGLVHVSQWDTQRVENMAAVVKPGDKVRVKVLPPDKAGRLSLSRKEAL